MSPVLVKETRKQRHHIYRIRFKVQFLEHDQTSPFILNTMQDLVRTCVLVMCIHAISSRIRIG